MIAALRLEHQTTTTWALGQGANFGVLPSPVTGIKSMVLPDGFLGSLHVSLSNLLRMQVAGKLIYAGCLRNVTS